MLFLVAVTLTSSLLGPVGSTTLPLQDAPAVRGEDPADALADLQQKFAEVQTEFDKLIEKAETNEERKKLFQEKYPKPDEFVKGALAIADRAKGTDVAAEALIWALQLGLDRKQTESCLERLLEDHLESESLGDVCSSLPRSGPAVDRFLIAVAEKSPHATAKGKALFARASHLKEMAESTGDAAHEKQAIDLFNQVVEEYAGVELQSGEKLGERSRASIVALETFGIGKPCPDITGTDADGVAFKLSDYRGKVIFLDFWGFW